MEEKEYTIGGKVYTHKELVWAQWLQLADAIKGIAFPEDFAPLGMVQALKDKVPEVAAIVLVEKGKSPKDKDLNILAEEISYSLSPRQIMEIAADFFDVNPMASLLENLDKLIGKVQGTVVETVGISAARLREQSSISQEGTLPNET